MAKSVKQIKPEKTPKIEYHLLKIYYHVERLKKLGYKVIVKLTDPKKPI